MCACVVCQEPCHYLQWAYSKYPEYKTRDAAFDTVEFPGLALRTARVSAEARITASWEQTLAASRGARETDPQQCARNKSELNGPRTKTRLGGGSHRSTQARETKLWELGSYPVRQREHVIALAVAHMSPLLAGATVAQRSPDLLVCKVGQVTVLQNLLGAQIHQNTAVTVICTQHFAYRARRVTLAFTVLESIDRVGVALPGARDTL